MAVETEHCGRETLQPVLVSAQQLFKTKLAKEATVLRKNPTHCEEKTSALTRLAAGVWRRCVELGASASARRVRRCRSSNDR